MCDLCDDLPIEEISNSDLFDELSDRDLRSWEEDLFKLWKNQISLGDQQKYELVRDFIDMFTWEELDSIFSFAKVFRKIKY